MEGLGTIIEAVVNSGGYAALCVLLVICWRDTSKIIAENTAAVQALLEHFHHEGHQEAGAGRAGGAAS